MRKLIGWYFSLLFILLAIPIMACVHPVSLGDRVDNAAQIVMGTVIKQEAAWDTKRENIYTIYTLHSEAYLKGSMTSYYIDIILPGGIVEDEAQIMNPSIDLRINQFYLFTLENLSDEKKILFENISSSSNPQYQLYAYVQGALPKINDQFYDYLGAKPISQSTLLRYIKNKTGIEPVRPDGTLYYATTAPRHAPNGSYTPSRQRRAIILKDGDGNPTNTFYAGTANTTHELIIEGNSFGNTPGLIKFSNSDNGGQSYIDADRYATDLISWTDTKITIKIPQTAGTGTIQIYDAQNNFLDEAPITIKWSLKPIFSKYKNFQESTRQTINFTNYNGEGGYTLHYNSSTGLSSNADAVAAFERAMEMWQCSTGINWIISPTSTVNESLNDDESVIMFSPDVPAGVVAMTSSRYKASGSTKCDLMNTTWYLKEFDMEFAHPDNMITGLSWSYSQNPPAYNEFDFETISLHELGHAHGLGHINDSNSAMYFSIENGILKRNLEKNELEAGAYQMALSKEDNCITSKQPMEVHSSFCGVDHQQNIDQQVPKIGIKIYLEGYYNANTKLMRTELAEQALLPLLQPFGGEPYQYQGTESVPSMPTNIADWILIGIREAADYQTILCNKAVLLRSDGLLVDLDASEEINFDCIPPGTYYVSITHQNHLSVLTNGPIELNETATLYDFTLDVTAALGEQQLKLIDDKYYMNSGDFDCNGIINNTDYNLWKTRGAAINLYVPADADGNGVINSLDYNFWKVNSSKVGMLGGN